MTPIPIHFGIDLEPDESLPEIGNAPFDSIGVAFRDMFATHVVVDDEKRFVTGQNQNSGLETAHKMMQVVADREQ